MPSASMIVALLGVISVCAVAMTCAIVLASRDLHRTLRHFNRMLPHCDDAVREAHQTLTQARKLLGSAYTATHLIETVAQTTVDAVSKAMKEFARFKARTHEVLAHQFGFGNGARSGPRRHVRGS